MEGKVSSTAGESFETSGNEEGRRAVTKPVDKKSRGVGTAWTPTRKGGKTSLGGGITFGQ